MTPEEIKNSDLYKALSSFSNSERGYAFEQQQSKIEKHLNVTLKQHSYMDLGSIKTDNPMISYLERDHNIVCLMEFVPNS